MATYASETSVTSEKSRMEIERTLQRYGADKYMYGAESGRAVIVFELHKRRVRFDIVMPEKSATRFTESPTGRARTASAALEAWEQACRQRWRALALVIKAKLEAVESGITLFEEEFLAHIILPNQMTVGQWMLPQVEEAYAHGTMPELLPSTSQRFLPVAEILDVE